jgi:hypothetical protein
MVSNLFYLSHLIKPISNPIENRDGEKVFFYIQLIKSSKSEKRTVCVVENEKKRLFNADSLEESLKTVEVLISKYKRTEFEILSFDHPYEVDFTLFVVESFLEEHGDLQEKINHFLINKELK